MTPLDPFLKAHAVGPIQFNLSYPLTPVSIRDQMIRGTEFVKHAQRAGILEAGSNLLVVGAGVAGATCAMRAFQHGVHVDLIDHKGSPFSAQRGCDTRWVDPVQYDWPAVHWNQGYFPKERDDTPLGFPAGYSGTLADLWSAAFFRAVESGLRWWPHVKLESVEIDRDAELLIAELRSSVDSRSAMLDYDCVVYALGFGIELSSIDHFAGYRFWENDPFERPRAGCVANGPERRPTKVKIIGGGDGAAQDFLRIVTGLSSAKEILEVLAPKLPADLLLEIYTSEDQARRTMLWASSTAGRHRVLQELHDKHKWYAEQVLVNIGLNTVGEKLLERRLKDLDIELLHPCTHFSECFALNRFLVHLLALWAKRRGMPIRMISKVRVEHVDAVYEHSCNNDASDCFGQEHRIHLALGQTCLDSDVASHERRFADVLVIRRGVQPPSGIKHFLNMKQPEISRQLLPYYPW